MPPQWCVMTRSFGSRSKKPENTMRAMPSLATRAYSGEWAASPSSSGLGSPSVTTCCTSRNFSRSIATRCSMSQSMRRLDMRFTMPGSFECVFTSSRYAGGMTWLKRSIFMRRLYCQRMRLRRVGSHGRTRKMKVMAAPELIEAPLSPAELAARYAELCDDPSFAKVQGKIEIDLWGRLLMSPPARPYHGRIQAKLSDKLAKLGGERTIAAPIATPLGLFVADLAWSSQKSPAGSEGDPALMHAPELCIEVVSPSNSRKEMNEKVAAYLAAGAEEVWIVYPR